jgi:hypothetical protein
VVILPPCKEYNLDYQVNNETVHTEDVYVECETAYQEINKEIYLNPVTLTDPAQVKDLPYEPTPTPSSTPVVVPPVIPNIPIVENPVVPKPTDPIVSPTPKPVTAVTPGDVNKTKEPAIAAGVKFAAEFTKYYGYNMKDIDPQDPDWTGFISQLGKLIEENGSATLIIEAGASKVPTKTFRTNENLSKQRMEDARQRLISALKNAGIDADKVFISAINHLVLGPNYAGDYQNTEKYGKYQYVKLRAN